MKNGLPKYIFFTGVPGSRWSGIAQEIKQDYRYDTSDRAPHRVYTHGEFSGHKDAYFGTGMEFPAILDEENLEEPFERSGTRLLMSHEWPYHFDEIIKKYPEAWIQLIYREDSSSFVWWKQAGGWDITYPDYSWYEDDETMFSRIRKQNQLILDFAQKHVLQWTQHRIHNDIFIAIYKP